MMICCRIAQPKHCNYMRFSIEFLGVQVNKKASMVAPLHAIAASKRRSQLLNRVGHL